MPTAVDSSVLIAAVSSWHEDHERCLGALDSLLAEPPVVLPQHALIESYSVLTRLPAPHRLAPETAHALLERTLSGVTEIAALPPEASWHFLDDLRDTETAGGAVYDALIVHCAIAAGADRILTLNTRHFERLRQSEVDVVEA